jgi:ABC-type oligopeptide transport system substrate-binding subunit
MKKLVFLFTLVLSLFVLASCGGEEVVETTPTISGAGAVTITVGDTFTPATGVTANDATDGDLTADITISGTVNTAVAGTYNVTYTVENSFGKTATVVRVVTVVAEDEEEPTLLDGYAQGEYSYKFADTELRATLFGAAERYLLLSNDGGIPVFANSGFNLYASRLQLPVTSYIPVMGFGTAFATMSADDAATFGGDVGSYTYRTALAQNPTTFNQWTYDDATSSDVIGLFLDSIYTYKFNDDKTGYEVVPSMAASDPVPMNETTTATGFKVAKTWQVTLRDDLEWSFHQDTDTTGFSTLIDANDFVDTFKLALDEGWFRAISGGGDFFNATQEIVGAKAYYDAKDTDTPLAWDTVGFKVIGTDELTIEFDFVNDMSEWNVKYWLSDFVTTPIHLDLYDEVGDRYGTSPDTTAYNGVYQLDSYQPDRKLVLSKNENFHDKDSYFFTDYTMDVIEDAEVRFQEFIAGNLEAAAVTSAKYDQYKNNPLLKRVPGTTTFRLMINGLGTVANQQAQFDGSTYVPEPILANSDFKTAMYFAFDRQELAEEVLKTSQTQMYHFTDAYLVDAETGVPFRNTPQGQAVGVGLSPETNGYDVETARSFFYDAVDALVADGTYAEDEEIEISLYIFSGSEAQSLFGNFIKASFEDVFNDTRTDGTGISVTVNVEAKPFPGIYYDYMMTGSFDLSIGGISGSTLDAAGFLEVYASDNRGGFTLNWGIDTSKAEIEVTYDNPYDELDTDVTEMWSFDALISALTGTVYTVNGEEAEMPAE